MRKGLFLLLFSILILKAQSQDKVFEKVEHYAHTDQKQWNNHIVRKTQLPDSLLQMLPTGIYTINVQFIIDKMGNVGEVKALNDPGHGFARRAENIISSYKGEWQPAIQCGRAVKAYRKQQIVFIIP